MNVLVVADVLIPTLLVGIVRPLLALQSKGLISLKIKKNKRITSKDIKWCDTAVFCRSQDSASYNTFKKLKKNNKKVIYDIDDNFFELDSACQLGQYHRSSEHIYNLEQFLTYSDVVNTYSEILYNKVREYNSNVNFLKCYFDSSIVSAVEKESSPKIKIAYATGRASDPKIENSLEDALVKISEEYQEKIEIHFWREPFSKLKECKNIKRQPLEPNYEQFIRTFYRSNYHIGLAPLANDKFYNSKTNNKYREYAGCKVAAIYSDVPLYQSCITHGENGLLVNDDSDDWYEKIKLLIESEETRNSITSTAYKDVSVNYSFDAAVESWGEIIKEISSSTTMKVFSRAKRSRVLIPVVASTTKLSKATIQIINEINTTHFAQLISVGYDDLIENPKPYYLNNISPYYVCSGSISTDRKVIKSLSEKYEKVIVDNNNHEEIFSIDFALYENVIFVNQYEDIKDISVENNEIKVPDEFSPISIDNLSARYLVIMIRDIYLTDEKVYGLLNNFILLDNYLNSTKCRMPFVLMRINRKKSKALSIVNNFTRKCIVRLKSEIDYYRINILKRL